VDIVQSKWEQEEADHVQLLISEKKKESSLEELMTSTDALTKTNFPFLSQGIQLILVILHLLPTPRNSGFRYSKG